MKAVYIRTSTEDQNPENQIADIETISGKQYILYKDQQSAWKEDKERPDFERLLNEIKASNVSDLYVWDFDRLYRNRLRVVEFFKLCKAFKCNIHSYRQSWLESIYKIPSPWNEIVSELLIQIMGWMAQEESDKKSQRVKAAIREKDGVRVSYKGNKWGRKEIPITAQNEIIRLSDLGFTLRSIAAQITYTDSNNHPRHPSLGVVHKTILENRTKKDSQNSSINKIQ